jgi:ribonuclease P protein component
LQRLLLRTEFQAVLAGKILAKTTHFALHARVLDASEPIQSLGAMVPKRWARRAVTRNTIKRQVYNVSPAFASVLPIQAYVLRLRAGFDRSVFVSASSDVLKIAVRTELLALFAMAVDRSKGKQLAPIEAPVTP